MIKVNRDLKTIEILKNKFQIQSCDELHDWIYLFYGRMSKTKLTKAKFMYKCIIDLLLPLRSQFENEEFYKTRS
jgi:hypothetical protein